jgi:hypothetical protein
MTTTSRMRPIETAARPAGPAHHANRTAEWIDPEGNDWLADIYRQVAGDGDRSTADRAGDGGRPSRSIEVDLEHWFG